MGVNLSEFEKFADIMADSVISKLVGRHENFERFYSKMPSTDIFIGNLAEFIDIEDEDNPDNDLKRRYLTNSESVKFLINEFKDDITVDVDFNIYYRVFPTFQEQVKYTNIEDKDDKYNIVPIWQRKKISFKDLGLNEKYDSFNLDFTNVINEIKQDPNVFLYTSKISKDALGSEKLFLEEIEKIKNRNFELDIKWDVGLKLTKKQLVQDGENFNLINISLINKTIPEVIKSNNKDGLKIGKGYFEPNVFDAVLKIKLNKNELEEFKYSYFYEDYPEFYCAHSRCLNCNAEYDEVKNEFLTKGYGKFKQPKISPRNSLPGIDLSFDILSREEGLNELNKIHSLMVKHLDDSKKVKNPDKKHLDAISNFDLMQKRFKDGIDLLNNDSDIFRAFSLMNKTFYQINANSEKGYMTWRLFQVVFIVSLLRDIVDKDYNKDVGELLHVMTGGGKSESYFGLVIFSAFYDRITGKEFGITAVTKFPLRLLSIQQLQRIANIFMWAEEIRQEEKLGGDNFSIAYFVGNSDDFPNVNDNLIEELNQLRKNNQKKKGQIIEKCPICGDKVYLDVDLEKSLVIHRCEGCNRIFRLYFTDDEIYRTLPTFIVSTVDKLAGISWQVRVKNIWGGKVDICPNGHGFIPHNSACGVNVNGEKCGHGGEYFDVSYDLGPSLIIQDELHLINEGFGAIDSHFETLIEKMHEEFTGNKFKYIVMTATVTGAKNQIRQLYNKDVCIFPPKLLNSKNNDFFFQEEMEDGNPVIQREIIGLKPNSVLLRLNFYILRYISEFLKYVDEHKKEFCEEYGFDLNALNEIIPYYKKLLTYHNRKEDVHAIPFNTQSFVDELDSTYNLDTHTLTGENNLESIKDTINLVENYYEINDDDELLVVSATNIVSHGVDIDEWNAMIFDGIPRSTSEYIQALSRVGRKKCGIIFLSFRTSKTRDLSFYQHFDEYHNILDHKVEIVPLTRWTKIGFKQTLTSIFIASVINYMADLLGERIYNLAEFKRVFSDEKYRDILMEFIKKVYLCDSGIEESKYICGMLEGEVNERINFLMNAASPANSSIKDVLKSRGDKYYGTQWGMRGIQDDINLVSDSNDIFFRKKWGR